MTSTPGAAPASDELYRHYHDHEWGVPEWDSRALWEKLVLDGFQAGLSWITILRKREAFRDAFAGFDPEKVNPNGSGIGLGHAIGATGAVITVKAMYELERIGGRYGLITMCIGGGQGIAMVIERCA